MVGGTSVDITEQKRVEEALRESESFRRMIIESEPECVKLVAPDFTLLDMNPAGIEMIEANSREQVVGQSVLDIVAPECRNTYIGMHQRVCQGESVVAEFEIIGLKGSHRWMESHAAPLLDKESRVIAHLAITRDITERKLAVEALRESEERYRVVSETASEAIITIDESSKILFVNPSTEQIFGYSAQEMLGEPLTMLMPEYRRHVQRSGLNRYVETSQQHMSWTERTPGLHKCGKEIPLKSVSVQSQQKRASLFHRHCPRRY